MQFQSPLDGRTRENHEATDFKNVCFVYAKHYFLKTCPCKCLFRLRETLLSKNRSLLVYAKQQFFFENCGLVYAKHYFFSARLAGLGAAVPMRRPAAPKNKCSRLRETLLFKNVPLQVLVSSTRNATFKKQVAPRLRETLVFLENCALVYAKHYFFASSRMGLSRQAPLASWQEAPRQPGPVTGQSSHFFCTPSAAKSHAISGPEFWPGQNGSVNVTARVCIDFLRWFHEGPCEMPEWTFSSAGGSA